MNRAGKPNQILSFLTEIFKPFLGNENLYIEIRPLPQEGKVRKKIKEIRHKGIPINGLRYLFPLTNEGLSDAVDFALKANENGYHAYFGVLPRAVNGEVYTSEIFTLYQDLDFHHEEVSATEIKNRLKKLYENYKIVPNIVISTGRGVHYYFLLQEPIDTKTFKAVQAVICKTLKADEKVAKDIKRILRLPYTINWKYEELCEIDVFETSERIEKEKIESIAKRYKGNPKDEEIILDRDLKDEQIKEIVEAIKPFYVKGHRHNIVNYLTAYLFKNGIKQETAFKVIEKLTEETKDEEREKRIYFVEWLYENKSVDEVKGYSGLEEEFETIKEEYNVNADVLETLSKIQEILGKKTIGRDSLIVYTRFYKTPSGFINSRRRKGIYAFVKEENGIKLTKEIVRACIENVKIVRNPYTNTTQFTVSFRTKTGRVLEAQGSFKEILTRLENEALIVNSPAELALSSLLTIAEENGLAQVIEDIEVQGFYINKDGNLIANWELPESGTEKVVDALNILHQLITKWFNEDPKAVATLKWAILSPFFFTRKQLGFTPWKWLFLLGTGGTGKSTLLQTVAYIYKVPLALVEISAGSISTEARLGKKLSQWSFPFIVNEAKGIFTGNEDIRELMKNAWDRITFRGKYKEGQFVEELSLAPLAFTSNEHIEFTQAELRRMDVFVFTWKNRISEEKRIEFERWKKKLELLQYLGKEIYKIIKEGLEEILSAESYLLAGEVVLERLYKKYSLEVPSWVYTKPSEEDYYGTEKELKEELKHLIVNLVNEYVLFKLKEYIGTIGEIGNKSDKYSLKTRLRLLKEKNIPSDVLLYEPTEEVVIKKGFLSFLKKNGVKVGTLKEVAELLGGSYGVATLREIGVKGLKVVRVPASVFEEGTEEESEEELMNLI